MKGEPIAIGFECDQSLGGKDEKDKILFLLNVFVQIVKSYLFNLQFAIGIQCDQSLGAKMNVVQ